VLDDRAVGDSTAIIEALEVYQPEPALYPLDPADLARALELEDYFDENLAPAVRAFGFFHVLKEPDKIGSTLYPEAPDGRAARVMSHLAPVLKPAVRVDYNVTEEEAERSLEKILAAMDRLESEIGPRGYLVGDSFTVADLTAAALFTPIILPPGRQYKPPDTVPAMLELRGELEARDGGKWVHEMFRRHRGASHEIRT
jgi:glutathione S-transferase